MSAARLQLALQRIDKGEPVALVGGDEVVVVRAQRRFATPPTDQSSSRA